MDKETRNTIITMGTLAFFILLFLGVIFLLAQPVEYNCEVGNIKMDFLVNGSNFSHFQLNEIDGVNCNGSLPAYALINLNG